MERCSSAIFPDDLEAGQYPPIEFETKKDNIVANIYDPGNYKIYWNNGSVLSIGSSEKIEEYVIMGNWVLVGVKVNLSFSINYIHGQIQKIRRSVIFQEKRFMKIHFI